MKARVLFGGHISEEIAVENGVKLGDVLAPTLFSLFLSTVLWYAFHDCEIGVYLHFHTSGDVFNLRKFNTKTLTYDCVLRELLYADDADILTHSALDMQAAIDRFLEACTLFGLAIYADKTKVMYSPPPGMVYNEPHIYVNGRRLEAVKQFVYLGCIISNDGTLDSEINARICKPHRPLAACTAECGLILL